MRMTTQDIFTAFDQAWAKVYGRSYVGFGPKLGRMAKPVLEAKLSADELGRAAQLYLADVDPYLTARCHPFELWVGNRLNRYLVGAPASARRARPRDTARAAFLARVGGTDDR